jgi:quinohemoprotein ethanol dehydrogenase
MRVASCPVASIIAAAICLGSTVPAEALAAELQTTAERIEQAAQDGDNWLSHGKGYDETRNSSLTQINTSNVSRLGLAWYYDLDVNRGQESTPLVVDGIIYSTSAWSKVEAFDGASGKLLWRYDPHVPGEVAVKACCDVVNRGVAYWEGKVFVGALDGRLIALDARTGKEVWSTLTVDPAGNATITGAPRVVKGKVIIGNGGAEMGMRGYVSAYDAGTGGLVWRFYTVPGKPGTRDGAASDAILDNVSATWKGHWWSTGGGGGGTVWDSMAYDPTLDLLYVGVGNSAYWPRAIRSPGGGDNLFVASILALRPDTGEYVWHYQETPGDQYDYTATQQMILADVRVHGVLRHVLMQAPKNGFFYILDRTNGKLLSATPYAPVNWATGVDLKTGRPRFVPESDYSKTGKPFVAKPGPNGAHNWMPMALNPQTGFVYIPVQENGFIYQYDKNFKALPTGANLGLDYSVLRMPDDPAARAAIRATMKGSLVAWNPELQKEVWRAPHEGMLNGGVLSTSGGLVFQGTGTGQLNAYDARTGQTLWSFETQSGIIAPPVSWAKDGRQYLTLVTGWGGSFALTGGELAFGPNGPIRNISRVLTFSLDGAAKLPPLPALPVSTLQTPPQPGDAGRVETGRVAYNITCLACHGADAVSGGPVPDLRYSPTISSADAFRAVVLDGVLKERGMVSFRADFTAEQVEAIRAFVISRARWAAQTKADVH